MTNWASSHCPVSMPEHRLNLPTLGVKIWTVVLLQVPGRGGEQGWREMGNSVQRSRSDAVFTPSRRSQSAEIFHSRIPVQRGKSSAISVQQFASFSNANLQFLVSNGNLVFSVFLKRQLCESHIFQAIHHLGIPTTRAGSCVTSESKVVRDIFYSGNPIREKCTIILRIAPTFVR